jgi:type II secretory pathway component PulJ
MVFRFTAAVVLVALVALAGAVLEKSNLALRRRVSQQQYRLDELREQYSQLRSDAQRLGAPSRWLDPLEQGRLALQRPQQPVRAATRATPLLNWTAPSRSDVIHR